MLDRILMQPGHGENQSYTFNLSSLPSNKPRGGTAEFWTSHNPQARLCSVTHMAIFQERNSAR